MKNAIQFTIALTCALAGMVAGLEQSTAETAMEANYCKGEWILLGDYETVFVVRKSCMSFLKIEEGGTSAVDKEGVIITVWRNNKSQFDCAAHGSAKAVHGTK